MGKYTKIILLTYIFIRISITNSYAIESAAHKAEVIKCLIASSFILNFDILDKNIKKLAINVNKNSTLNIKKLEISKLSIEALEEEVESNYKKLIDKKKHATLANKLNFCVQTLKIGK